MDRAAFVTEAALVGIDESRAAALHERVFPQEPAAGATGEQLPSPAVAAPAYNALSRPVGDEERGSQLTRAIQVLVWLGVMLVIAAHAWWTSRAYDDREYSVVLLLTLAWQGACLGAAEWSRRRGFGSVEAGFAAIVAFYAPLSMYALERVAGFDLARDGDLDFYDWLSGGYPYLELASVGVSVALLLRYRRPFVMLPVTLMVAFSLTDGVGRLRGAIGDDFHATEFSMLIAGIAILVAAVALDLRGWRRFAFWPHVVVIWFIGWELPWWSGGANWSLYLVAVIFLVLGTWLARMVYLAAGGLMTWIAVTFSARGGALPFVLLVGGIAFIVMAIWLAQRDSPVRRWLADRELRIPQRDLHL